MKVPCTHCPWRPENHGKRTPWGFYTKKNLQRLWNQVRGGGRAQSCHPTDPNHPDHIAAGAKPDAEPQECAGSVILIFREFDKLQMLAGGNPIDGDVCKRYLTVYPRGLTKSGLMYWLIQRYQLGGVPFMGGPKLPEVDVSVNVSYGD